MLRRLHVFIICGPMTIIKQERHRKEACPWHRPNLRPHKKVNTLQGCTDASCWLSFLLWLKGRCNSYRHRPALPENCFPSKELAEHIQYPQNTSARKAPYKEVDLMMGNYTVHISSLHKRTKVSFLHKSNSWGRHSYSDRMLHIYKETH